MFDYDNIKQQVTNYCEDYMENFDIPTIMEDLRHMGVENSIDEVGYDEFVEILKRHDQSEN